VEILGIAGAAIVCAGWRARFAARVSLGNRAGFAVAAGLNEMVFHGVFSCVALAIAARAASSSGWPSVVPCITRAACGNSATRAANISGAAAINAALASFRKKELSP
jgi:hypothetical protein